MEDEEKKRNNKQKKVWREHWEFSSSVVFHLICANCVHCWHNICSSKGTECYILKNSHSLGHFVWQWNTGILCNCCVRLIFIFCFHYAPVHRESIISGCRIYLVSGCTWLCLSDFVFLGNTACCDKVDEIDELDTHSCNCGPKKKPYCDAEPDDDKTEIKGKIRQSSNTAVTYSVSAELGPFQSKCRNCAAVLQMISVTLCIMSRGVERGISALSPQSPRAEQLVYY